jgi:hypothetical protein
MKYASTIITFATKIPGHPKGKTIANILRFIASTFRTLLLHRITFFVDIHFTDASFPGLPSHCPGHIQPITKKEPEGSIAIYIKLLKFLISFSHMSNFVIGVHNLQ